MANVCRRAILAVVVGGAAAPAAAECFDATVRERVVGVAADGRFVTRSDVSGVVCSEALVVHAADGSVERSYAREAEEGCAAIDWKVEPEAPEAAARVADRPSAEALTRRLSTEFGLAPLRPSRHRLGRHGDEVLVDGVVVDELPDPLRLGMYGLVKPWRVRLLDSPRSRLLFLETASTMSGARRCVVDRTEVAVVHALLDRRARAAAVNACARDAEPSGCMTRLRQAHDLSAAEAADIDALGLAAENGDLAALRRLLERGTPVDALGSEGQSSTALGRATCAGQLAAVEALVARGADVKLGSPLLCAVEARERAEALVRLLVGKGADVRAVDGSGRTPLALAAATGAPTLVRLFLDAGAAVDAPDSGGATPLAAAAAKDATAVRLLLDAGADRDRADAEGRTPLRRAIGAGATEPARVLLEAGAAVDRADAQGRTPLMAAACVEDDLVALLLAHGADARARTRAGTTVLHEAAACGSPWTVARLLRAGVGVDQPDLSGETPLIAAIESNRFECVGFLLGRGARPDAVTKVGKSAYARAVELGRPELALLLERAGARPTAAERAADDAERPWQPGETVEMCHPLTAVGKDPKLLDLCLRWEAARPSLVVRNNSELDASRTEHLAIGAAPVPLDPGERVDGDVGVGRVGLAPNLHLLYVTTLRGPARHPSDARLQLFVEDAAAATLAPLGPSPACGAGCVEQSVHTARAGDDVLIEIVQDGGGARRRTRLRWVAERRALEPVGSEPAPPAPLPAARARPSSPEEASDSMSLFFRARNGPVMHGHFSAAEPILRQAIAADPSNLDAWELLGELLAYARPDDLLAAWAQLRAATDCYRCLERVTRDARRWRPLFGDRPRFHEVFDDVHGPATPLSVAALELARAFGEGDDARLASQLGARVAVQTGRERRTLEGAALRRWLDGLGGRARARSDDWLCDERCCHLWPSASVTRPQLVLWTLCFAPDRTVTEIETGE
jgi:ankyrin repeat protein